MIHNLSQKITTYFIKCGDVKKEDQELYAYGFEIGITLAINIIASVILLFTFQMVWEGLLFFAIFFPLRTNAGGTHMNSHWSCFLVSCSILVAISLISIYTEPHIIFVLALTVVSVLIIWFMAPVDDKNKPMDEIEEVVYGKRARIVLAIEVTVEIILLFLGMVKPAYLISLTLSLMAVLLILGKLKNNRIKS